MNPSCAAGLKSQSQIARRVTEQWADENLFCPSCSSTSVKRLAHNKPAVDFSCPDCRADYLLKSGMRWSERKVPDAGYDAMMTALMSDSVPNLIVLQYTLEWAVRNLMIVPSFFFTPASIEKRKPLASTARRAGWVGCNIVLSAISDFGKIRVVQSGRAASPSDVRRRYDQLRSLGDLPILARGWTLNVLRLLQ